MENVCNVREYGIPDGKIIGSFGLADENQERLLRKAQRVRRLIVEKMNELFKEYDSYHSGLFHQSCWIGV